ncbi:MAG: hypothetical protein A2W19_08530 [Spirochaetes bacterium RBG_16_49_21]|nr:MAG: hypothetical protein A2W19_08530 [Spirochaetes bacterium RBG_16_49_21]
MKKKLALLLSIFMLLTVSAVLLANVKIMNKEVGGKKVHDATKNGQKVNTCNYCHVTAKLEKKKLGYLKGQPKFATLKSIAQCAGPTCHH